MGLCLKFGYLDFDLSAQAGPVSILTLPSLDAKVAQINSSPQLHDQWYYAPPRSYIEFPESAHGTRPFSQRVFRLPKTHAICHEAADGEEHLDFLIWCLGFFLGRRFSTVEWGYLDATPIGTGKLCDFHLGRSGSPEAITLADRYWHANKHHPRQVKRVIGILHALHLGQNRQLLDFEKFIYLYTALDGCYKLYESFVSPMGRPTHAQRFDCMCSYFGIQTPEWADPRNSGSTEISVVRNDAIHEALFFGEPLGFAIYSNSATQTGANIPLQMANLVCRLLVALLGKPDAAYVNSPVNLRQIHGLDLR